MGREVEEHDIYASEQCVSRCVCVQQKGVKVSDVCGVSQKALGNASSILFGVIAIDTIGMLSCAATCGTREKDWPEEMPKATANPLLYQEIKKTRLEQQ